MKYEVNHEPSPANRFRGLIMVLRRAIARAEARLLGPASRAARIVDDDDARLVAVPSRHAAARFQPATTRIAVTAPSNWGEH